MSRDTCSHRTLCYLYAKKHSLLKITLLYLCQETLNITANSVIYMSRDTCFHRYLCYFYVKIHSLSKITLLFSWAVIDVGGNSPKICEKMLKITRTNLEVLNALVLQMLGPSQLVSDPHFPTTKLCLN